MKYEFKPIEISINRCNSYKIDLSIQTGRGCEGRKIVEIFFTIICYYQIAIWINPLGKFIHK